MAKQIEIIVGCDGIISIRNVPEGVEIVVEDAVEGGHAVFGEGNNNILSQKV